MLGVVVAALLWVTAVTTIHSTMTPHSPRPASVKILRKFVNTIAELVTYPFHSKTCFDYKTETECTSHKECRWPPPRPKGLETMNLGPIGCYTVSPN